MRIRISIEWHKVRLDKILINGMTVKEIQSTKDAHMRDAGGENRYRPKDAQPSEWENLHKDTHNTRFEMNKVSYRPAEKSDTEQRNKATKKSCFEEEKNNDPALSRWLERGLSRSLREAIKLQIS